jgi:hypothetical protein
VKTQLQYIIIIIIIIIIINSKVSPVVGFEVLTAVVTKSPIFLNVTPCSLLKVNLRSLLATCFHAGFLLGLFDPEDGGDMFLRNVGRLSTDYTALSPRRQYFS